MGFIINDECDSWHVLHCKQDLIIFQRPIKKIVTNGKWEPISPCDHTKKFTRVSQNGISLNLAKKHTHIFINPTTN